MSSFSFDLQRLIDICRRNDVSRIGVFGSVARGQATASSDLDLLVEFRSPKGLLALVSLERQLSDALGVNVDLLTEAALSPYLRDRITHELQIVYEA